MYGALLVL
jgi:manganese oxidase